MSAKVQLLDQNTSNQIAAGEVVEKPASVVKELVENSLDAGADTIEVSIFAGGTEFIRVRDNGSGMDEANARMAILRHATSKIVKADDLLTLHTLGFRGEALPSIASVSHFTLLTREAGAEFATRITLDGGEDMDVESMGGDVGTTITVKDLFYNVPARRKFLRTVNTEGRYISDILSKIALSRPDVHLVLTRDDKEVINTPGSGDLVDTIASLYGKEVTRELLTVDYAQDGITLKGFISRPTLLKGTRQWQTLFVNGRCINNRMVSKAIDHAYQSQIPKAGFPFAVLNIGIDTHLIDINVHPQKSEIKFGDESAVYRAVYHGLCQALTQPMAGKSEGDGTVALAQPGFRKREPAAAGSGQNRGPAPEEKPLFQGGDRGYQPRTSAFGRSYASSPSGSYGQPVWKVPDAISEETTEKFFAAQRREDPVPGAEGAGEGAGIPLEEDGGPAPDGTAAPASDEALTEEARDGALSSGVDLIWPLGQVDRVFIIAQSETALYLIDQHAAHERIMYDKFIRQQQEIPSQQLLIPLFLNVTRPDVDLIEEYREEFLQLGVDVEPAGETSLRVSALPADVESSQAEGFIEDILKLLSENKKIKASDLRESVLHYAACHSAIRAGEVLNIRQMRQLILELLNTEHPFTCPHGRPCMIQLTSDELYHMFKRT
ncbi:DNA mismatch repair endonuclease MutL [Acidaminococcus fermentans]|uniref:DNA mismatch repair protein MutL n=4 Tax=Acidaminococcus fermentans TaxID=905 RepID=D2RKH0_ACIFV|nr:DNA mismatch repair endonuclease MutL [Acidaminococcus fermentans]ADB47572.1 DNA mismatch repair protein MutL [Acidaminococcus fermentans DSM 20731]MCI7194462.1 DNA mismatch repair endonuclease MutL [Acidaminococcus fermentans]MDY2852370.1 DNA mismatch repair endonuclease MutL [Acidaminococcus fermentans]UEA71809.1 DNA mismatch repair endonuclease MutL [Acidaminococcus fermentans DSM 20731]